MAEKGCAREGLTRRSSFRRGLLDGSLPLQYLESLEKKRRQLDESIHKYIASKEREYKQFERDLRQQTKTHSGQAHAVRSAEVAIGVGKRRTSSESTQDPGDSLYSSGQQGHMSAVGALLTAGSRRDSDVIEPDDDDDVRPLSAGLTDRRASIERDKEFVGVFTPNFMHALDNKELRAGSSERASFTPTTVAQPIEHKDAPTDAPRPTSDTAVRAMKKRPAHLQELAQRTSSSGSSVDAKLASAMKSPTHTQNIRIKRKRVSLAVGDSIVAPSDSVPMALSNNSTPSHSRNRSPAPDRASMTVAGKKSLPEKSAASDVSAALSVEHSVTEKACSETRAANIDHPAATIQLTSGRTSERKPTASKVDPDGDLFELEDSDVSPGYGENGENESELESEDDVITGRVDRAHQQKQPISLAPNQHNEYDPEAGLVSDPESDPGEDQAMRIEFGPPSADASQQPTLPGFRHPSVIADPVFEGPDYSTAEQKAVDDDIYGSSYSRPTTKGSFTGGSLGESFMARHAQEMGRSRPV